jgi:MFS family permease
MKTVNPFSTTLSLYKDAYSGLSQSTWLLSGVMLVNRSGTMVLPFMTIYLTAKGFSLFQAGIVVGLFGAGAMCGGFLGGRLTDKWGFHQVQLITLSGGGLLFILLGLMKSYPLICIFTFILSVPQTTPPLRITARKKTGPDHSRLTGWPSTWVGLSEEQSEELLLPSIITYYSGSTD